MIHRILDDPESQELIGWGPEGDFFIVKVPQHQFMT
jgi:hypothetical protein